MENKLTDSLSKGKTLFKIPLGRAYVYSQGTTLDDHMAPSSKDRKWPNGHSLVNAD